MVLQMLQCTECYENIYTQRRTNYPSFNAFLCKRSLNTRHTVTVGKPLQSSF
jgi:hypothetical protein